MAVYFLLPNEITHQPGNISACLSEEGLVAGQPVSDDANLGYLHLRGSGTPYAEADLEVQLQTGGNPTGYQLTTGSGAAVVWREAGDADDEWRGYRDTMYLESVRFPVTWDALQDGIGHPRELPDGYLGILTAATGIKFWRVATDWTASSVTMFASVGTLGTTLTPDWCVLPSGRLVAIYGATISCCTEYSDDNGATWSPLGSQSLNALGGTYTGTDRMYLEYVDDLVVLIIADSTGANPAHVFVSRDGGASFGYVGQQTISPISGSTCVTKSGTVLFAYGTGPNKLAVLPITPGGRFGEPVITTATSHDQVGILCRDDGTIFAWSTSNTANSWKWDCTVSSDEGATWEDAGSGNPVIDADYAPATMHYQMITCGMWRGAPQMLGLSSAAVGASNSVHLLVWGGWDEIPDPFEVYQHTYLPVDYPDAMVSVGPVGWILAAAGGGAPTVTNKGPLRIVADATGNNEYRQAGTPFWNPAPGDRRTIRFRNRVASGGSVVNPVARLQWSITDGAGNQQLVEILWSSTAYIIRDGPGNVLGSGALDMTLWTEWEAVFEHDRTAGAGRVNIRYQQDGDTFSTDAVTSGAANVVEQVGASNLIRFGGTTAAAVDWEIALLEVSDSGSEAVDARSTYNPSLMIGRPLSSSVEFYVHEGLRLGGFNGAGIPDDSYTYATTYSYGKGSIWEEMRPSRMVRSENDNVLWTVTLDAGAGNLFHVDTVALLGTNFLGATWEMHTADVWAGPSVSQALSASLETSAVGVGNRGVGYFGPATDPGWRKDQWKSAEGNRIYVFVNSLVYEVEGNTSNKLFVSGVDFTLVGGAYTIFGDRMGAALTQCAYRWCRIKVAAQQTAEDYYRLGTVIADVRHTLTRLRLYSDNFIDRVAARVEVYESDAGYRSGSVIGPRRWEIDLQWDEQQRAITDIIPQLRDLYQSLNGALRPWVFWRDSTDVGSISLVRLENELSLPAVFSEGSTGVTRVDTIKLVEER